MGFLLSRKLVTPFLLAFGLLAMIGGEVEGGAWVDALGLGYWIVAGWITRASHRHGAARPPAQVTATVTAMSSRARRSDGASGAYSRLDPAWQNWLRGDTQPRHGDDR